MDSLQFLRALGSYLKQANLESPACKINMDSVKKERISIVKDPKEE